MNGGFLLTALVVVIIPGTGVIYTVSSALSGGRRSGLIAAFGCTLGIIPHLAAAILGLSALLQLGSQVFRYMKIAGVIYLLYLAWSMWRSTGLIDSQNERPDTRGIRIVVRGILLNLLNPKLTLFFFAFLPQFLPVDQSRSIGALLLLGMVFMVMTAIVFALYGILASSFRRFVVDSPRTAKWIQRTCAGMFAALAVRLAIAFEE